MTGKKKTLSPYYVVTVIILAFLAVFFLFPLYWIVTGSVKEKSDIIIKSGEMVKWIPTTVSWDNFARLFKSKTELFGIGMPMAIRWLFNSVFISATARLCPGKETLLGQKTDIQPFCVRHGASQTGYSYSVDEGNVRFGIDSLRVGLHVCSNLSRSGLALWRVHDETVL